ncbi:MAG: ABC transporter permease [Clostridiales Family XIII bacterium]|jgi:peptide/nickel transport system permease protein|nr:ABC transporter permease [Clostridiales Family XIII bacterium]
MKRAAGYIAKRILELIVSLVLLSFVIFSLLYIAPGDPARQLVGTKKATPELLARIRESYGLDDPFFVQYKRWIEGVLHFDFGKSIRTDQTVIEYVAPHASVTLQLVVMALVLSVIFGLMLGIVAAKSRGTKRDNVINTLALVGTSAPSFAVALLFLYVFALKFGWFPIYGIGNGSFGDSLRHLALPSIVLTFGVSALIVKITRSALLTEDSKDYTTFMRARAVLPARITFVQLKNVSAPVLTSTGLVLANLVAGTILVESVFSIPGLGNLLASSVTFHDVPVVQFIALALAFIVCASSALVDILVFLIDPLSGKARSIHKISTAGEKNR